MSLEVRAGEIIALVGENGSCKTTLAKILAGRRADGSARPPRRERIYVLQRGKVTEHGTHAELMKRNGHYAELFTLQASAYVD